jgi:phospholipid/cholesterol/gamma-HCH transport system permease protein
MTLPESDSEASLPADIRSGDGELYCTGNWTLAGIEGLTERLARIRWPDGAFRLDGSRIQTFDTTGALLLADTLAELQQAGRQVQLSNLRSEYQELLELVVERHKAARVPSEPVVMLGPLALLGRHIWQKVQHSLGLLAFLGETSVVLLYALLRPTRIRWRILLANIESAGLHAIPIVGLLSFLIGVVIAYQGGNQLRYYGANIFIVDLVCLTMVRELAPLLTSIIIAGRTGSAFAAQIGTMQVTEEVDALRTIGINPFDMLVLPKLFGLCIALPLLSLFADAASIFGGMVVARLLLDVSFTEFIQRIPHVITPFSFLFGIGKTPVFAIIIALVGCYQGFQVRGGADSVGRQTTESVVQAIFLVIVVDAIFATFLGTTGIWR